MRRPSIRKRSETRLRRWITKFFYGPIKFTADGDGDAVLMGAAIGQVQKTGLEVVFPPKIETAKMIEPLPPWSSR